MEQATASPVERLAAEFADAVAVLNDAEANRNRLLHLWAELRTDMQEGRTWPGLLHKFESTTSALQLAEQKFNEAVATVRRIDLEMGTQQREWALACKLNARS